MQTLRGRQNLHKILERKAELAVNGEKMAQHRLYESEADVEVKHGQPLSEHTVAAAADRHGEFQFFVRGFLDRRQHGTTS